MKSVYNIQHTLFNKHFLLPQELLSLLLDIQPTYLFSDAFAYRLQGAETGDGFGARHGSRRKAGGKVGNAFKGVSVDRKPRREGDLRREDLVQLNLSQWVRNLDVLQLYGVLQHPLRATCPQAATTISMKQSTALDKASFNRV